MYCELHNVREYIQQRNLKHWIRIQLLIQLKPGQAAAHYLDHRCDLGGDLGMVLGNLMLWISDICSYYGWHTTQKPSLEEQTSAAPIRGIQFPLASAPQRPRHYQSCVAPLCTSGTSRGAEKTSSSDVFVAFAQVPL